MSPFPVCQTGLLAAFQQLGEEGLVRYHRNQLQLGLSFVKRLNPEQLKTLLSFARENAAQDAIQTGVAAQLFRILLKYTAETGAPCKDVLAQLLLAKVVKEAESRFDGMQPQTELEQLILKYMDCYALAYTGGEFNVISDLRTVFSESGVHFNIIFTYVVAALYLEEGAVDYLVQFCENNAEIYGNTSDYNGLYFIMQNAIRNPKYKQIIK